jgi:hypothetical protein
MFCPHCGTPNADRSYYCVKCRGVIQPIPVDPFFGDQATARMILPIGRSGWAIAAGYAGLLALAVFPAPLALGLGLLALRDIRRHPHRRGLGRAWFGTVTGAIGTLLLAWLAVELTMDTYRR